MEGEAPAVPGELEACPPAALEEYARARITHFNAQPSLSQALDLAPGALADATARLLGAAAAPAAAAVALHAAAPPAPPADLALAYSHECQHPSCTDARCQLCAQSQSRHCRRTFASKYLCGDLLRAACGAVIRCELVDASTGRPAAPPPDAGPGARVQLSVLDGKGYAGLKGAAPSADDLQRLTLAHNQQGGALLACKAAKAGDKAGIALPLGPAGGVLLADLAITGSSEAMLSGQKPPFLLLARLVDSEGREVAAVRPALSDAFVVATPRVRTATKKAIPHEADDVSKISCVGNATQAKLRDLARAAQEAGAHGLAFPMPRVSTAGEFRRLVEWAEEEAERRDQVKKVLKLTKGWDEAREHALRVVATDNRLRIWYASDALDRGLLFACHAAVPRLDGPLALLESTQEHGTAASGEPTLQATLLAGGGLDDVSGEGGLPAAAAAEVRALRAQAAACWARRGHPGWAVAGLDTEAFLQMAGHLPRCLLPAELVAAAKPQASHAAVAVPVPSAVPTLCSVPLTGAGAPAPAAPAAAGPAAALRAAAAAGSLSSPASPPLREQRQRQQRDRGQPAEPASTAGGSSASPRGEDSPRASRSGARSSQEVVTPREERRVRQRLHEVSVSGRPAVPTEQMLASAQPPPPAMQQPEQQQQQQGALQRQQQHGQPIAAGQRPTAGASACPPLFQQPWAAAGHAGCALPLAALPSQPLPGLPLFALPVTGVAGAAMQPQSPPQQAALRSAAAFAGSVTGAAAAFSPGGCCTSLSQTAAARLAAAAAAAATLLPGGAQQGTHSLAAHAQQGAAGGAAGAAGGGTPADPLPSFPSVPSPLLLRLLSGLSPEALLAGLEEEGGPPLPASCGGAPSGGAPAPQAARQPSPQRVASAGGGSGRDWAQMLRDAYASDPSPSLGECGGHAVLAAAPAGPTPAPEAPVPPGRAAPGGERRGGLPGAASAADLGLLGALPPGRLDSLMREPLGDLAALLSSSGPSGADPGMGLRPLQRLTSPEWVRLLSFGDRSEPELSAIGGGAAGEAAPATFKQEQPQGLPPTAAAAEAGAAQAWQQAAQAAGAAGAAATQARQGGGRKRALSPSASGLQGMEVDGAGVAPGSLGAGHSISLNPHK